MINYQKSEERQKLYDNDGQLLPKEPRHADPQHHTMGPINFIKYIGRYAQSGTLIDYKKFNKPQAEMLSEAYNKGLTIHVISAYRKDFEFLLKKNKSELIGKVVHNDKLSKKFNGRRQVMGLVATDGSKIANELWVLVFPSKQYVDQIAELIQAILNDFIQQNNIPQNSGAKVQVSHFPTLENSIASWTGFRDFISLFVRHGDVVVIGNIELLLPGLRDHSFIEDAYIDGGLDEMFAISLAINRHSSVRLILIGAKESYWGNASAQYVNAILEAGAMHILSGTKAASLIDKSEVHRTYAPAHFTIVDEVGDYTNIEYQSGNIGEFIKNLGISTTGYVATVPTVIGESLQQRDYISNIGPTCMDCEDSHIAQIVASHNQLLSNPLAKLADIIFQKQFIPIHFITDYIYRRKESVDPAVSSLAVHAEEVENYLNTRNAAFRKIGNVFAAYALTFGLQNLGFKVDKINPFMPKDEPNYEQEFAKIRPLLGAGLGLAALSELLVKAGQLGGGYKIIPTMLHTMICQKDGYINSAYSTLNLLKSPSVLRKMSEEDRIRMEVTLVKINSQVGSLSSLSELFSKLNSPTNQNLLKKIDQFGAVKRREAVFKALTGDEDGAKACINNAREYDVENNDTEYQQNNTLYELIAGLQYSLGSDNLKNISNTLSKVRSIYLSSKVKKKWWKTNFERTALAALFLESSYYLCSNIPEFVEKGAKILTVAHLFNIRLGGNEVCETYGEIVACTPDFTVKNVLSLAMRKDPKAQVIFQCWVTSKFNTMFQVAEFFKTIFLEDIKKREEDLLKFLNEENQSDVLS